MVTNALVSSRLDYCKSLFYSLSSKNITRLQSIQYCLASFVSGASRFSHVTPPLKSLHWRPVKQRIIFKTLVLVYISTSPLGSQSILPLICLYIHLLLKQDMAIQKRCFSRFLFTAFQFINQKFISTNTSHMMLQNSGT